MGENSVDFRTGGRSLGVALLFLIAQQTLPAGKHFLVAYLYTYQTWIRVPGAPPVRPRAIPLAYIRRDRLSRPVHAIPNLAT